MAAGNGIKILGFFVFCAVALVLSALLPLPESINIWLRPLLALGVSWFCLRAENEELVSIGLRLDSKFFGELSLGALLGMAIIFASAASIMLFGGLTFKRAASADLGALFFQLGPFLAVGVFEELVFRGYAFQRAVRRLGGTFALLLFALFFVAAHLGNPGMEGDTRILACLDIGIASLLLGLAYLKTGSLALPIGIHTGWNWVQGGVLGIGVSGTKSSGFFSPVYLDAPKWLTGGDFGLEASLPTAFVTLVACLLLILWRSNDKKRDAC